ncbi:hypothetical protein Efla_004861 [Eimeria flavescens]
MKSVLNLHSLRASLPRTAVAQRMAASAAVCLEGFAGAPPKGAPLGVPMGAPFGVSRPFSTGGYKPEEFTSFGNRQVPVEEKKKLVDGLFTSVADKYDLMNDLMSWGIHRLWKNHFVELINFPPIQANQYPGEAPGGPSASGAPEAFTILDLAGGTGDIAFRLVERALQQHTQQQQHQQQQQAAGFEAQPSAAGSSVYSAYEVTVCDINADMLRVGMSRAEERGLPVGPLVDTMASSSSSSRSGEVLLPRPSDFGRLGPLGLRWVRGSGEELPFADNSFNLITIAFGLRNFTSPARGLREALRVLKPGGRFLCLEFSKVENAVLSQLYDAYSFAALPLLGSLVAGDRDAYRYLAESIRKFPSQEELASLMQQQGFRHVAYSNMSWGVVAIHSGFKT